MRIPHFLPTLLLSALCAGVLFAALPAPPKPHIKGILPEVFNNASFDKKREALRADFKEREAIAEMEQSAISKINKILGY